ncbi:hypothetical protein BN1723_012981 [Verticillium longisporum]|uniref:Uncharacterized protein n=1 Tax=Verticillium longisporum TaxID=100787 RepID=A0A0G4LNH1_VERLO|nr:hypothetical protein BN1723_012981 [Verticillium longisporum]
MLDANLGHGGRSRSPSASSDNGLPPYADAASTVQDGMIPPETLLLAGTTIHSTASITTSPPLYELSLALGHLTPSHQKVELSRLDYHVRRAAAAADRGPEVAARKKHMYNLSRPTAVMQSNFPFYLESVRRSNLGHVGFKKRHKMAGSTEYRALRVTRPSGVAGELKGGDVLFSVKATAAGRCWRTTRTRTASDALVGTWCLRVWWEIVASKEPLLTWEQVKPLFEPGFRQFD